MINLLQLGLFGHSKQGNFHCATDQLSTNHAT